MPEIANSSKLILKQNKQNDVELFNAVSDRLQAISYQNRHCISPNTEVYKDLKIYGMDFCGILIWINDCYEANFYIDDISEYVPPDSTVEWVKELLPKFLNLNVITRNIRALL